MDTDIPRYPLVSPLGPRRSEGSLCLRCPGRSSRWVPPGRVKTLRFSYVCLPRDPLFLDSSPFGGDREPLGRLEDVGEYRVLGTSTRTESRDRDLFE